MLMPNSFFIVCLPLFFYTVSEYCVFITKGVGRDAIHRSQASKIIYECTGLCMYYVLVFHANLECPAVKPSRALSVEPLRLRHLMRTTC